MARVVLVALLLTAALGVALQLLVDHERTASPRPVADQCRSCHLDTRLPEESHAALSCAACHLGNAATREPKLAHVGLVRIPGNAADMDRTCGAAGCHQEMPPRLRGNIMNTMMGVVSVDRWVFGEQPTPTGTTPVSALGHSPADTHLRNLCASCHLSNPKVQYGPLDERSRGGGCNACHLVYSTAALADLDREVAREPEAPLRHPGLRALPRPIACFGCHSRSGRVSLNFEGWMELSPSEDAGAGAQLRQLDDGRVVRKLPGDVHAEAGFGCVDCHGSWEVMGDGTTPRHREEQSTLRCTDCHLVSSPRAKPFDALDVESQKVAKLARLDEAGRRYLTQEKNGVALINTFLGVDGGAFFVGRYTGRVLAMKPPAVDCTRGTAHDALACGTCHEAWVPQCVSCHTRFDEQDRMFDLLANAEADGAWHEDATPALAERATLGVRAQPDGGRRIEEFAPGMVLTISPLPAKRGAGQGEGPRFKRLFAPVFAHTLRREARPCLDCHASPLALGYGRGTLKFADRRWTFTPKYARRPEDGLPQDAWIGFLETRGFDSTTREDTRPFTVEEQRRVLSIGVCLTCHEGNSAPMQLALDDLPEARRRRTPRCSD